MLTAGPQCKTSMQKITVNGAPISASWATNAIHGAHDYVLKVTGPLVAAQGLGAGTQLCFTLDGACATMEAFCGTPSCQYALFDSKNGVENYCCAYNAVDSLLPPPPVSGRRRWMS